MLNKICVDADYNIELVIWLQNPRTFDFTWDNSIVMHVNADSTANQQLVVTYGVESATIPVTSGIEQDIVINGAYWNMGGDTIVACEKDGSTVETFTFTFPDVIDSVGMLNQDENDDYHFTMTGSSTAPEVLEEQVKQNTEDVEQAKEDISDLYLNKQNFIHVDLLPPSGDGDEGDLEFYGTSPARLYRYENDEWIKKEWIAYGETNSAVTPIEGDVFIQNDGTKLVAIMQYINNEWMNLDFKGVIDYSTTEADTGIMWTDGRRVYQKTLSVNQSASANYNHNIGQLDKVIGYEAAATSYSGDDVANSYPVPSAEFDITFTSGQMQITQNVSGTFDIDVTVRYLHKLGSYVFDQDFSAGSSYKFNKCNKETLLTNLFNTWVRINKTYLNGNATYQNFKNNITALVNGILERTNSYASLAVSISTGQSGGVVTLITVNINAANTDNTYNIISKTTEYGYDYYDVNPSIPGPPFDGLSFDVSVWASSVNWGAIGGGGYNNQSVIGYKFIKQTAPDVYGVRTTNNGIHYI